MGGVPQGYAAHPNFAPGPPMPGVDRNGVPMHGSVPGKFEISDLYISCHVMTDIDHWQNIPQVSQLIPN